MKKLIVLLCIVCTTHVSAYSQEFWELLTPNMDVSCVDMNSQGQLFMCAKDGITELGGLFRSIDDGDSWEHIFGNIYSGAFYDIHCDDNAVYYSENGKLRRFNLEDESIELLATSVTNILSIEKSTNGDLYYGSSGLYHSPDNGITWDCLFDFPSNSNFIYDILSVSPDTLFLVEGNYFTGGGIYRSVDSGENWECVLEGYFMVSIEQASNGDLFAVGDGLFGMSEGWVMVSHDGGDSWENSMTEYDVRLFDITITPTDEIYCAAYSAGIYYSDDYGLNWEHFIADSITDNTEIQTIKALDDGHLYVAANIPNDTSAFTKLHRSIDTLYTFLPKVEGVAETLTAFPNPASESITIQLPENTASSTLQIIDINGRTVVQKQIASCESTVQLHVSSWNTGVYIAKLVSANRIMGRVKVLVR